MRGLDRILELQDLDTATDRLEHRREQLEAGEELSSLRKEMEEADARLDKLHAEEKRMYDGSIANAKELEALQHEIASLKDRRSRAEDYLLEELVRKEDVDARAGQAQTEAETSRARVEEVGGDAARELDQISADLAAKRSERGSLVPAFDEELLELYDDLREQKHGIGAAAIMDGVCQACHEKLSAVELERLKRTQGVKRCEYCRRIVVLV
jgi:predicted  nucleic acid-binding Zn-ribbon protein